MIYENKYNFPPYIVKWLTHDSYDHQSDTISATTLLKPARAYVLGKLHNFTLSMDVSDLIALKYGTGLHLSFNEVELSEIQEKRYYEDIIVDGIKYSVSGKPDIVIDGKVTDIKSTSVWSYIYGSSEDEHRKQLSIYKWLLTANGISTLDEGEICYLFTDWSKQKSKIDANYPACRMALKTIKLMSLSDTREYIISRLRVFKEAEKTLPECTSEELWRTSTTYAVKKENGKRAIRVFNSEEEAKAFSKEGQIVEVRIGKAKRCGYCVCRKYCLQYHQLKEKGLTDEV